MEIIENRLAPHVVHEIPDADYVRSVREDGAHVLTLARASAEEQAATYAAGLRRELAGVEHNLAHLDDPVLPSQEPPTAEWLKRRREELEGTRETIFSELARVEGKAASSGTRRERK